MQTIDMLVQKIDSDDLDAPWAGVPRTLVSNFAGVVGVVLVGIVAAMCPALWQTWLTADWHGFWLLATTPLRSAGGLYVVPLLAMAAKKTATEDRERRWREAIRAGDEQVAPLAAHQPELPSEVNLLLGPVYVGPLRAYRTGRYGATLAGALWLFSVAATTALIILWMLGTPRRTLVTALAYGNLPALLLLVPFVVVGAIFAGSLLGGLALARRVRRLRQPLVIVAADAGIEWIDPLAEYTQRRIRWSEMRALSRITYRRQTDYSLQHVYLLDADLPAGPYTLLWRTDNHAEATEQQASEQLAALIARHANVCLRDASKSAEEAARPIQSLSQRATRRATPEARRQVKGPAEAPIHKQAPRLEPAQQLIIVPFVVALVLLLAIMGVAAGLQRAQPGYYAGVAQTALARRPAVTDPLASMDGLWLVTTTSAPGHERDTFGDGAYHVTGGRAGDSLSVPMLSGAPYGDAAVEVTTRQLGHTANDGVGLVVRERQMPSGKRQEVVFDVAEDGSWYLYLLDKPGRALDNGWMILASGTSKAIQVGAGTSNTLLVVMRGDEYMCYVNGHWVGAATDDTLTTGAVGVYVNDATTEGVFTDFRVYPLAPSEPGFDLLAALTGHR